MDGQAQIRRAGGVPDWIVVAWDGGASGREQAGVTWQDANGAYILIITLARLGGHG